MIKVDDVVTLELTGRQLAKMYAILGHSNGKADSCIWQTLKRLLDPNRDKYDEFILFKTESDVLDYYNYEESWINLIFTPEKSESEKELDSLQQKMSELQAQMGKLKEAVKKEKSI